MVCTGAKSEKEAKLAVKRVVEKLSGHGITVKNEPVVEIQNIVAYANLYEEVDLERLVYKLRKTICELEQFPGTVYRMDTPKVVLLIFSREKLLYWSRKEKSI